MFTTGKQMRIQSHKNGSTTTSDYTGNLPNTKKNMTRNRPPHTMPVDNTEMASTPLACLFSSGNRIPSQLWEKAKQRSWKKTHTFFDRLVLFSFFWWFLSLWLLLWLCLLRFYVSHCNNWTENSEWKMFASRSFLFQTFYCWFASAATTTVE